MIFSLLGVRRVYIELSKARLRSLLNLVSKYDVFRQFVFHRSHPIFSHSQWYAARMLVVHATTSNVCGPRHRNVSVLLRWATLYLLYHRRIRARGLHHYHDHAAGTQYSSLLPVLWPSIKLVLNHGHSHCLFSDFGTRICPVQEKQTAQQQHRLALYLVGFLHFYFCCISSPVRPITCS